MSRRKLYRLGVITSIIIWGLSLYLFAETIKPPPRQISLQLLSPNGEEAVSAIVTIKWNRNASLSRNDNIWIGWSHDVRGNPNLGDWPYPPEVFRYENWEGCYCQTWHVITDSAPNTGSFEWNASEALEQCNGEWYPYYIKILAGRYMDASNTYFNITG